MSSYDDEVIKRVAGERDALRRSLAGKVLALDLTLETLHDVTAALDNALLAHGKDMTPGDAEARRVIVTRAEKVLARYRKER